MHRESTSIATIEQNDHPYWEVHFKPNVILTLEDVTRIYRYIQSKSHATPILMDWNHIQGIEFEALEYIARIQNREHPLAITSEPGTIGERYSHLINQLSESNGVCAIFRTENEAHRWILSLEQNEA